jgi:sigma-B regulation protein RsbU (phosphoserine phosphatase)
VRVLLADDDEDYAALVSTQLQAAGHLVDWAADGKAARAQLEERSHRIAVLDWEMPEMTGPELCRLVRERSDGPYTYLLVVTAKSGREHYLQAMQAGADDFLSKPLDVELLLARLHVAERILAVRTALERLGGMLTICMYCNAVRDKGEGDWSAIEDYVAQCSGSRLSHGCCPECVSRMKRDLT